MYYASKDSLSIKTIFYHHEQLIELERDTMIHFPQTKIDNYLRDIMKLNPFDAMIIMKRQSENQFTIEMINSKAKSLSAYVFEKGMDAQLFFHLINWQTLLNILNNSIGKVQYISMNQESERLSVYIQEILTESNSYYCVTMRHITEGNEYPHITFRHEITGLLNRKAFKVRWDDYYRNYTDNNLALLLIDIDRFKKYNESLGKKKADSMIKQISQRFSAFHNQNVELYHYSSDEFVLVVPYYFREEVELIANNILESLKGPFTVDNQEYFVTASIGISTVSSEQKRDLEKMMLQAEQALFYVKNHGRSHYRFFREEMTHSFQNEVLMEAHLRRAIELNELSIHLQPQIDLVTKEIDSFEALIRWNNPKFGYVPPSEFIPLAESSGQIIQIGEWILEQVCMYQQQWKRKGYRPVRIAVNISPKQFKQEHFADRISYILNKYCVDPQYIELEITESSLENPDETQLILEKLKSLGVYVSVDDFGTGYSSLSYLKKYPIDIIKIDQSFIADLNKDKRNEAIVKAIIALSHNLGLDVIAEGIEEKSQENFLKKYQCQKGQGFLYNKPLPVEDIIDQYLT